MSFLVVSHLINKESDKGVNQVINYMNTNPQYINKPLIDKCPTPEQSIRSYYNIKTKDNHVDPSAFAKVVRSKYHSEDLTFNSYDRKTLINNLLNGKNNYANNYVHFERAYLKENGKPLIRNNTMLAGLYMGNNNTPIEEPFADPNRQPLIGPLDEKTHADSDIIQGLARGYLARKQMKAMKEKELSGQHTLGDIKRYKDQRAKYKEDLVYEQNNIEDPDYSAEKPYSTRKERFRRSKRLIEATNAKRTTTTPTISGITPAVRSTGAPPAPPLPTGPITRSKIKASTPGSATTTDKQEVGSQTDPKEKLSQEEEINIDSLKKKISGLSGYDGEKIKFTGLRRGKDPSSYNEKIAILNAILDTNPPLDEFIAHCTKYEQTSSSRKPLIITNLEGLRNARLFFNV